MDKNFEVVRATDETSDLTPELPPEDRPDPSRRTIIKGLFAAPAIMAVSSVPAFATGGSPPMDDGKDDHHDHDWRDWYDDWHDDDGGGWWKKWWKKKRHWWG